MRKRSMTMFTGRARVTASRSMASLAGLMMLGLSVTAFAQGERTQGSAEHGGTVAETPGYRFEAVFRDDGLWLYPHSRDGKPIVVGGLGGTVTFYHPNSPQPWFSRPLRV